MKTQIDKKKETDRVAKRRTSNNHIKHINIKSNKGNYYNTNFPFEFLYLSLAHTNRNLNFELLLFGAHLFAKFSSVCVWHCALRFKWGLPNNKCDCVWLLLSICLKFALVITSNRKKTYKNFTFRTEKLFVDQFDFLNSIRIVSSAFRAFSTQTIDVSLFGSKDLRLQAKVCNGMSNRAL